MTHQTRCTIRANHPCLAGHFPGNPVVPGVVILDEIYSELAVWKNNEHIEQLSSVKFLAPIHPDQPFTIRLFETRAKRIEFTCSENDTVFVTGKLSLK